VAVSIHPNLILGRLDARLLEHTGTSVGAFCVGMTYQTLQRMPPRRAAGGLCFNDFGHFIVSNPDIGQIVALRQILSGNSALKV
jgi:hypothetical protein